MDWIFYITAGVASVATLRVITNTSPVHALLYLIVSFLSVALEFYILGAPFAAAIEVIIYAGAIMVLFLFVVMMLNPGPEYERQEKGLLRPGVWAGPVFLAAVLLFELAYGLAKGELGENEAVVIGPKAVGSSLFGPYVIGVELASLLLLAAVVGVSHLGRGYKEKKRETGDKDGSSTR